MGQSTQCTGVRDTLFSDREAKVADNHIAYSTFSSNDKSVTVALQWSAFVVSLPLHGYATINNRRIIGERVAFKNDRSPLLHGHGSEVGSGESWRDAVNPS